MRFHHDRFHRHQSISSRHPSVCQFNYFDTTLPTNDSAELIRTAKIGLKELFKEKHWYKKAGIIVCELTPENHTQINLFRNLEDDKRQRKLM